MKKLLIVLVIALIGLGLIGFGVYSQFFAGKGYVETTAKITRIDKTFTGYDNDNIEQYEYEVYVSYTVDGKEYNEKSDYYSPSYTEGQEIKISHDPSNPSKMLADSGKFGYFMIGGGVLTLIIGAVVLLKKNV